MGPGGPTPQTNRINAARSSRPAKAPPHTDKRVRYWFRLICRENPHLNAGDTGAILQYAEAMALQQIAMRDLLAEGITILDTTHGDGTEKRRHPSVITWRTACEVARQAAMRLGVTPMDRARVVEPEREGLGSLADVLFESVTVGDD